MKPASKKRMKTAKAIWIICQAAKHAPWYVTQNKSFVEALRLCRELARARKHK